MPQRRTNRLAELQQPPPFGRPDPYIPLIESVSKNLVLDLQKLDLPDQFVPRTAGEHEQQGLEDASHKVTILAAIAANKG